MILSIVFEKDKSGDYPTAFPCSICHRVCGESGCKDYRDIEILDGDPRLMVCCRCCKRPN